MSWSHVRRGDAFVGVLQMIVQVLWWFHPLVWWANRDMCRRREQCCDEEVVAGTRLFVGGVRAMFAGCFGMGVGVLPESSAAAVRRARCGSAEITTTRLEHIMDDAKRFHRRTPRWTWGVLAMAMLLVLPGRAMVLGPKCRIAIHEGHEEHEGLTKGNVRAVASMRSCPDAGRDCKGQRRGLGGDPIAGHGIHANRTDCERKTATAKSNRWSCPPPRPATANGCGRAR